MEWWGRERKNTGPSDSFSESKHDRPGLNTNHKREGLNVEESSYSLICLM